MRSLTWRAEVIGKVLKDFRGATVIAIIPEAAGRFRGRRRRDRSGESVPAAAVFGKALNYNAVTLLDGIMIERRPLSGGRN
jgi:hypothetical protein